MCEQLQTEWNKLCDHLHIPHDLVATYADIVNRYKESGRHYHTPRHLAQCFIELAWLEEQATKKLSFHKIRAAIFLHDVVYDPRRSDNEEKSAVYAELLLRRLGACESFTTGVARLVRATETHEDPGDENARYFLDIDLSILGQSRDVFDAYERAIRKEYAHVSDADFFDPKKGRPAILERFLKRKHIFFTELFRKKYEQAAQGNLIRSLACMVEG